MCSCILFLEWKIIIVKRSHNSEKSQIESSVSTVLKETALIWFDVELQPLQLQLSIFYKNIILMTLVHVWGPGLLRVLCSQ